MDGRLTMRRSGQEDRLDGLDFSDLYKEEESLISPEWSAGGLFALQELLTYYQSDAGRGQVDDDTLRGWQADSDSIRAFLNDHSTSYAVGPGLGDQRQGNTGFGWQSYPEPVTAMASIYGAFSRDPLAAWRR